MDDTKRVIDLEKAREELEQTKQEIKNYEQLTFEEKSVENMDLAITGIEKMAKNIDRILDIIQMERERTTYALGKIEKVENDLMEQGIFVGSYNLDDID